MTSPSSASPADQPQLAIGHGLVAGLMTPPMSCHMSGVDDLAACMP